MIRAEYRPESDKFESVRSEDPDSIKKGILVPLDPGQSGWPQEDHTIPSQHVPVLWQDISDYGSDCTQECPGFVNARRSTILMMHVIRTVECMECCTLRSPNTDEKPSCHARRHHRVRMAQISGILMRHLL